MPRVPRAQRQVGVAPLPGARLTAAETAVSRGAAVAQARAGLARTLGDLGGAAARVGVSVFGQIQEEERQRADEIAVLSAERRLSEWENDRLHHPERGALAVRGREAFGLPETVREEFDRIAGEVERELVTPRQRTAFQRVRLNREASLDLTVRRHVFQEVQRYEAQELQAFLENAQSAAMSAALDPRRVGQELARMTEAIQRHAPRLGMGPEQVQAEIEKARSVTHVGVVDRLLANDQIGAATAYFEETRDEIKGDAIARVERALETGGLRKRAQEAADRIVAGGGTLSEQLEQVRAIDDAALRDEVRQRVEHEATVRDRVERERLEDLSAQAYSVVDRTRSVDRIPADVWAALPGGTRAALRSYAQAVARGVPVETDLPTYYGLMQQAMNDPQAFAATNLLEHRGRLGETEFKALAGLQLSMRRGETTEKDLSGFRTKTQMIDDSLALFGIDPAAKPTTAEGRAIAQLRRMVDRRVDEFQGATGKAPANDDVQAMIDDLLSQSVKVPGSWWNIWPGGKPFFDQERRLIDFTIDDIPQSERTLVEEALRKAGRPVSDATVLDLYLETRARTGGR